MRRRGWIAVIAVLLVAGGVGVWMHGRGHHASAHRGHHDAGVRVARAPEGMAFRRKAPRRPPRVSFDQDPVGNLRLEGQVIDLQERPIGGATVIVNSHPPRTTTTQEDGSFAFDKLVGRKYAVTAKKGALVGGPVMRKLTATSDPVVIHVRRGAAVQVKVIDADTRRPIAGAKVALRGAANASADTGSNGVAKLVGVAPGFSILVAHAKGYADKRQPMRVPGSVSAPITTTVALRRGAAVSGEVISPAGEPVAGAHVVAIDAAVVYPFASPDRDGVVTDKRGRFRIAAVAAGTYRFVAHAPDYPRGSSSLVTVDGSSDTTGVKIKLAAGGRISGHVVTKTGRPVKWATVQVAPRGNGFRSWRRGVRQATADATGAFSLTGLPREKLGVVARSATDTSDVVDVDLAATADVHDLTVVVHAGGVIAGKVETSAGEPVAEAQVTAYPDIWSGKHPDLALGGAAAQTTGGAGHFKFQGLAPGDYRLRASRGGASFGFGRPGTKASTGDTDVEIVLDPPGGIRGQVELGDGSPATLFTVTIGYPPGAPVSDPQGKFELHDIPTGTHDVDIRGPGFTERTLSKVKIEPNKVTDLGTITVKRGRHVAGRVLDSSGAPVQGATVVVGRTILGNGKDLAAGFGPGTDSMMGIRRDTSDDSGAYRIDGIPTSRLVIAAEDPKLGRSLPVTIPRGKHSVTIDLPLVGFGSIDGTVTVNGAPPTPALGPMRIMATPKAARTQIMTVMAAADGSFEIARVAAGAYHVSAMLGNGMGGSMRGKDVTVQVGEPAQVTIDLHAGDITVSAIVKGTGGAKVDAAQVFLIPGAAHASAGAQLQKLVMSGGGSMSLSFGGQPAKFQHITAGRYSLCAIAISGKVTDPGFWKKIRDQADTLAVRCAPRTVDASPPTQTLTVTAPLNTIAKPATPAGSAAP